MIHLGKTLAAFAAALATAFLPAASASAAVPAVVMSDHQTLYSGLTNGTFRVAANSRGDTFFADIANKTLDELPAGTTTPVILLINLNGPHSVDIDSAGNVYLNNTSGGKVIRVPFVSGSYPAGMDATNATLLATPCSAGLTTDCVVPTNSVTVGYYSQITDTAIDGAGDYYFLDVNDNVSAGKYNRIIKLTPSGVVSVVVDGLTTAYNAQIASDAAGNLYYANGTSLYSIPAGASTATAMNTTTLSKPTGVYIDFSGNLIVSDSGNSRIVVMPFENGAVNFSDQYVLSVQYTQNSVGMDSFGTIYYTGAQGGASSISALQTNTYNAGSLAIGSNSTLALVYAVFNAATTFTQYASKGFGATPTIVANTCALGTTYTAGQSCSFNAEVKPNRVGPVSSLVGIGDASGNFLAEFALTATGLGSAESVDPGTAAAIGSGFTAPAGVAVDRAGNVFIADSSANAVYELVGGTGTPVSVGTGLLAPTGVTVDAEGNLFIADAGNSRVVEVPVAGTTLVSASQAVIATGLTSPLAIASGPFDSLYIAQSGSLARYQIRAIPPASLTATLSTTYIRPRALTVDPSGDVFLADGSGSVVEFAAYTNAVTTLTSGLALPTGLATDAAGDLFVADNGTAQVVRVANTGGMLAYSNAVSAGTFTSPLGLATDSAGNLIVSDPSVPAVYRVTRTTGLVNFGAVNLNTASPVMAGSILSSGNQTLTLGTPLYTQTGDTTHFAISSTSTCAAGGTLASGTACSIAATYTPTAKTTSSDVLAINAAPTIATSPFNLTFTGTGTFLEPTTLAVALTSPTGTLNYGTTATITATLSPMAFNVAAATGTVTFTINGVAQKPIALSNNTATIQTSALSGGANSVTATYNGDINYAPSNATAVLIAVVPASTTTTLTIVTNYINPVSALPGAPVVLTAIVTPSVAGTLSGNVNFVSGSTVLGSASLTQVSTTSTAYQAILTTTTIPAGTYNVMAVFPGTANYAGSNSTASPLIVSTAGLLLTSSAASLTSTPSTPGGVTLSLESVSGLGYPTAVPVSLSCSGLPAYAVCRFNPGYTNVLSSPASAPVAAMPIGLTIQVNVNPGQVLPVVAQVRQRAGIMLACLFGVPLLAFVRRRRSGFSGMLGLIVLMLLLPAALFVSGCSSGASTSNMVTPTGTSVVTVTATSASSTLTATSSVTLNLTVGN